MICRDLRKQDLMACLEIAPAHIGDELVGRAHAIRAWGTMIQSPSFKAAVIEADPPIAGHRVVGFGSAVFVSRAFAEDEISNPRPGLNSRIIASIHSGWPVILSDAAIRSANTNEGLDSVILFPTFRNSILSEEEISEVHMLGSLRFLDRHAGYRINQLITEAIYEGQLEYFAASRAWRIVTFDDFYSRQPGTRWNSGRGLAVVTRQEAHAVMGSIVHPVFQYREPVLSLRDTDQQLLIAALSGMTNQELSQQLRISLPAVKKRWNSVFERTFGARPDLFPSLGETYDDSKRGEQKRHRVLAYVGSHPEELRPIERASRATAKSRGKHNTAAV